MNEPRKCIGLIGWMFGHKYVGRYWTVTPVFKGLGKGFRSVLKAGEKFPYPK